MITKTFLLKKLVHVTAAGALAFALGACADQPDTGDPDEVEELGIKLTPAAGAKLISRVKISAQHRVEFWQAKNGSVAVLEDRPVDSGEESVVQDLGGRGSFAALYQRVAGKKADATALARLRKADARPRAKKNAKRTEATTPQPTSNLPYGASPARAKSAGDDARWFSENFCEVRQRRLRPDLDSCWTEALDPPGQVTTWNVDDFELLVAELFNASSSGQAHLQVNGIDCGFLELGLCSGIIFNEVFADPRTVVTLVAESDDGFNTTATGDSYAVYYGFAN